jgi:hypothetical protein
MKKNKAYFCNYMLILALLISNALFLMGGERHCLEMRKNVK